MRKVRWAVPLALQARCFPMHVIVYGIRMLAIRYSEQLGTIYRYEEVFQSCHPYHALITHPCTSCLPAKLDLPSSIHPTDPRWEPPPLYTV